MKGSFFPSDLIPQPESEDENEPEIEQKELEETDRFRDDGDLLDSQIGDIGLMKKHDDHGDYKEMKETANFEVFGENHFLRETANFETRAKPLEINEVVRGAMDHIPHPESRNSCS